ncbi:MAG: class I SAM-dependent methyltransferase [Anaerolineaceae bacterium]|nr:class I SAM-dependent methyltransferase [Anaerolineaceae bacterium]
MKTIKTVLKSLAWFLGIILAYFLAVQLVLRLLSKYMQLPIPPFLTKLIDNPLRRKVQSPEQYVKWMQTREGETVLEIGPGAGPFSFALAQAAGQSGHVYALDIAAYVVSELKKKILARGVGNMTVVQGSASEIPFPDDYFDQVMMVTVFGEIPDKDLMLSEIKRVLKPGGKLGIGELLLDPDYARQKTVYDWCENAGLKGQSLHGSHFQYLMTFTKPEQF